MDRRIVLAQRLRKAAARFRYGHFVFREPGRSGDVYKKGRQWAIILETGARRLLAHEGELNRRSAERIVKLAERFEQGLVSCNFTGRSGDGAALLRQWAEIFRNAGNELRSCDE